jgi:diadenosine tetraphosphate (Ap4A) HIT family hydrolase
MESAESVDPSCLFCSGDGGRNVWRDSLCRVVLTDEPFVGFCRVIWNAHVREVTDLGAAEREHLMRAVFALETALRSLLRPDKMNLASLGNMTPHVHWHVIPRFADDSHFPQPVWGVRQRAAAARALPLGFVAELGARLAADLGAGFV